MRKQRDLNETLNNSWVEEMYKNRYKVLEKPTRESDTILLETLLFDDNRLKSNEDKFVILKQLVD